MIVWFPAQTQCNYSVDTATQWNFVKLTRTDVADVGFTRCNDVTIKKRKSINSTHTQGQAFFIFFNSLETYTYSIISTVTIPQTIPTSTLVKETASVFFERFQCRTKNEILYVNLQAHNSTTTQVPTHQTLAHQPCFFQSIDARPMNR